MASGRGRRGRHREGQEDGMHGSPNRKAQETCQAEGEELPEGGEEDQ